MNFNSEVDFKNAKDPHEPFSDWLAGAKLLPGIREPGAMTLSTVDAQGRPSSRVVLLKKISKDGLYFYTNYSSPKGVDLSLNPNASLLFYWDSCLRQIRVNGSVKKISREESEEYWSGRPFLSQISQLISIQSHKIKSRESMEELRDAALKKWENKTVPCPPNWGGYSLLPDNFEFWVGKENRLHDRFVYGLVDGEWEMKRVFP